MGSVVASAVWELIFTKFSSGSLEINRTPDTAALKAKVGKAFNHLDPTGKLGDECWRDFHKKVELWIENSEQIENELKNWNTHSQELRSLIKTPEEIVYGLISAGSPITFEELEPAFDENIARWAVSHSHLMRNRFVGIDLLEFLGLWDESAVDWVFERAQQAVHKIGALS